ncbi:MAG: AAA domain-containing protein, partial [Ignavibacteria bacterium]|nr:AAA domain-containing protein [Ignavibacteria bacterium]
MVALDVVYKRLEEARLGVFCLQLHGLKTNKKELLSEIVRRNNLKVSTPAQIEVRKQNLQHTKQDLIEVSSALSKLVGPEQIPLHNLIWRVEYLRQELPQGFKAFETKNAEGLDLGSFTTLKILFSDLGKEWTAIPATARQCWHGFIPINYEESEQATILDLIDQGQNTVQTISKWFDAKQISDTVPSLREVSRLIKLGALNMEVAIPPFPPEADQNIAYTVINANILPAFRDLLDKVIDYQQVVAAVNRVFDYYSHDSSSHAEQLNEHVKKTVKTVCNPETAIADLPNEKQLIDQIILDIESLPELGKPVTTMINRNCRTLGDYEKLTDQAKELTTGPIELLLHANPIHASAVCSTYLKNAKKQYVSLKQEEENNLRLFYIADITDTKALREAYNNIRRNRDRRFALLRPSYRHARKYIRNLMSDRRVFSRRPEFISTLELLDLHCQRRQQFAENRDFQAALGNLFKGMETDWEVLENIVIFSRRLSERVGRDLAQKILSDWSIHVEVMEEVIHKVKQIIEATRRYASSHCLPQMIWQRPTDKITDALRSSAETIKAAINTNLQKWCNPNSTLGEAIQSVTDYYIAKKKEQGIQAHEEFDRLLRSHWNKSATHMHPLESTYGWINDRLKIEGINLELLRWLILPPGILERERLSELVNQAKSLSAMLSRQYDSLKQYGEVNEVEWYGGRNATLGEFEHKLSNCIETLSSLPLLLRWRTIYQQVCDFGYKELADSVSLEELVGNQCKSAYEFSVYEALLKKRISSEPKLARFGKVSYENLRERFSKLDKEILKTNAQIISAKLCDRRVPEGVGYGPIKDYTQKRLLLHESSKKRHHLPIRQLIKRTCEALVSLKPCFLMSPLSVAQYLVPGRIKFDLVVMDEASQLRPEDALGAIARARKAIIVGDPKQLPPTTFFDTAIAEEEDTDETVVTDTESILDVCLKQFPFRRLRWHYRSRHEALIQFSNQQFYEDNLIIFPSPRRGSREYGVHYTLVDKPSYRNGRNRGEAEVVVENIIHHFQRHPKKSLGVAAFNRRQAEEIELLLERRQSGDPSIDDVITRHEAEEPLFIKNLENVQGDERDVIFISTTYGPEKIGGPVYQRFGPLNSDVGWRRLNVIVTRARDRVEVFSSLRPTDIRIGDNARRGVRALRNYLEYASSGRVSEHGTKTRKEPDSEFEEAVSNLLQNMGYQTEPQVGVAGFFIDIGVLHPNRPGEYLMGIECDGAT